jgi:hypothetical protein
MSLWLDWWWLIGFGMGIVFVVQVAFPKIGIKFNRYNTQWMKWILYFVFLGVFYMLSLSLFAGFTLGPMNGGIPRGPAFLGEINDKFFAIIKAFYAPYFEMYPNADSTEFMFSSGQVWIRERFGIEFNNLTELAAHPFALFLAIIGLCLYPLWLKIGIVLGELMFGTKPGKHGMWETGWFFFGFLLIVFLSIMWPLSFQYSVFTRLIPGLSPGLNLAVVTILVDLIVAAVVIGNFLLVLRPKIK